MKKFMIVLQCSEGRNQYTTFGKSLAAIAANLESLGIEVRAIEEVVDDHAPVAPVFEAGTCHSTYPCDRCGRESVVHELDQDGLVIETCCLSCGLSCPVGDHTDIADTIRTFVADFAKTHGGGKDWEVLAQRDWIKRKHRYGNDARVSMWVEGPLNHIINGYSGGDLAAKFKKGINGLGYWWDFGTHCTLHFYRNGNLTEQENEK